MRFQLSPLGPVGGVVWGVRVTEQETGLRFVNDEPDAGVYPHRPKVLVPRFVEFVEAQARTRGVHLQVKGRCFYRLLLVASEAREAVGEGVGDAEVHQRSFSSWRSWSF